MAQLQQYWTYGLDAPQYSHTTWLTLPKVKPSATIVRPTPMLSDLLNPVINDNVDDTAYLFNHPDPYGMIAAGNQDSDDDSDDDGDGILSTPAIPISGIDARLTIRGGRCLKISEFVDLENARLLARYEDKLKSTKDSSTGKGAKKRVEQVEWVKEVYSLADIMF
jgi:hypothetical protein